MCSEFWHGWFDDWGGHHHVTPVTEAAGNLDEMLRAGASVNIYMFHGGTNFGLTSGANDKGTYHPITTSYDYDAPLDEAGNPTAKYWAFREVIARHADVSADVPTATATPAPSLAVPAAPGAAAVGRARPARAGGRPRHGRHRRRGRTAPGAHAVRDRSRRSRSPARRRSSRSARSGTGPRSSSTGRASASSPATITTRRWRCPPAPAAAWRSWSRTRAGWTTAAASARTRGSSARSASAAPNCGAGTCGRCRLRTSRRSATALRNRPERPGTRASRRAGQLAGPAFARAVFDLAEPADLYLSTAGWGKGIAWVNGFCLGRYWSRGPQRTLYVPGPATRPGGNELIILELHAASATVAFRPGPDLGHTEL